MNEKIGIYPGTFDPLTYGHIDIIKRSLLIVDKLIIGVANNTNKTPLLSIDDRIKIISQDLEENFNKNDNISIKIIPALLTDFAANNKATCIIRGLRVVSDFEYEFQLAGMNRQLNKKIETVFLMSDPDKQVISSKFVKEIAKLNGKVDNFVTKSTIKAIKEKYD